MKKRGCPDTLERRGMKYHIGLLMEREKQNNCMFHIYQDIADKTIAEGIIFSSRICTCKKCINGITIRKFFE